MTAGTPRSRAARATPWAWLPGRVRDDAACQRLGRQRCDRRVRAAELERADRLERLGLQEPAVLRAPEGDQRRLDDDATQALGGGPDVVDGDQRRAVGRRSSLSAPLRARRWQSMQRAAHGQGLQPVAARSAGRIGRTGRRYPRRTGRAPRRRARAGSRRGRAARGHAAGRRPGWPRRPASRTSSGRARRSPRRSRRAGGHARRAARHGSVRGVSIAPDGTRPYTPWEYQHGDPSVSIAIDPVCGMEVDTVDQPPVVRPRRRDVLVLRQGLPARLQGRSGGLSRRRTGRRRCRRASRRIGRAGARTAPADPRRISRR